MTRKCLMAAAAGVVLATVCATSAGAITVYGNSASFGNNPIHIIDGATGVESQRFIGQPSGNGRGVVTIGNTLYYTVVDDANIYKMDRTTGAAMGSILTTNASMSTLAWDGSHFWTADYAGTNRAFRIDPTTGLNVKTINLEGAQNYMDGLEWFNGKLIGNRCDACGTYDIWDLDGNRLVEGFISTANNVGTGIAYDGANFLVSNIYSSSIGVYDFNTGGLLNTINLTGSGSFLIEDLSVDYAARPDTGGGVVPEPTTWSMMILGFGALGVLARRRRHAAMPA